MKVHWRLFLPLVVLLAMYIFFTGLWHPYVLDHIYRGIKQTKTASFYGKVMDEHGSPLPGARVTIDMTRFGWGFLLFLHDGDYRWSQTLTTDADGRFKLVNARFEHLVISRIRLSSYIMYNERKWKNFQDLMSRERGSWRATELQTGTTGSSPNNPAVFQMLRSSSTQTTAERAAQ